MNSEIITDIEYSHTGRRRSRRRRRLLGRLLFLIFGLLALTGILYWRSFGDLFRDRYTVQSRTESVLAESVSRAQLPPFGAELSVIVQTADEETALTAQSALLIEEGMPEALFSKNALLRMNPASTTKIMTCLIALERGDMAELWTAGNEIYVSEPNASMAGIREGDTLTAEQVLYGLMLRSGADTANMAALHIAGSEEAFVALMNEKAQMIGATGTHFTNTHGLTDPEHYTTAYDIYLMLHEAMKYELFRKIAGTAVYQADYTDGSGNPVSRRWENTNYYLKGKALLPDGFHVVAGKTGTTLAAGACLAQVSQNGEGPLLYSVVLKSRNHDSLYQDTSAVLEKIAHLD